MVYRIRYRSSGVIEEKEVQVEAHSPAEAMVKFRHIADDQPIDAEPSGISVTSEQPADQLGW